MGALMAEFLFTLRTSGGNIVNKEGAVENLAEGQQLRFKEPMCLKEGEEVEVLSCLCGTVTLQYGELVLLIEDKESGRPYISCRDLVDGQLVHIS